MYHQIDLSDELNKRLKVFAAENNIPNLKLAISRCIQLYLDIYEYERHKKHLHGDLKEEKKNG